MKDYTVGVSELRDHYNQLRLFKKTVRAQVKMEYEAKISFEIKSRTEEAELKFAKHLAAVKERDDMPVRVIQDEVLRTRTWSAWERIRDLAGVAPEFVRAEDVRELKREAARRAEIVYEWIGSTLYVHRDEKTGKALPHTIVYPLHNAGGTYIPMHVDELKLLSKMTGDRKTGIDLALATSAEAKRAYADGEQTVSTHPYDYINDLPFEKHDEFLRIENAKFTDANPWIAEYS